MEAKKKASPYHDFLIFVERKNIKGKLVRLIVGTGEIRARGRNEALVILQRRIAKGKYDVDRRTTRQFRRGNKNLKCIRLQETYANSTQERLLRVIFFQSVVGPFKRGWRKRD